ncbi:MAG: signal peptide peptidase [Dehalococcoidia bacterium]|nr:signal peptide peptidase [Dehalococcoidia bacterium]
MSIIRSLTNIFKALWGAIIAVMLLSSACSVGFMLGSASASGGGFFDRGDTVAVVKVVGPIMGGDREGLLSPGGAYSNEIVRQLRQAGESESVKAVVLRVDSPGGGVTASDEIYNQVMKLRKEQGKPVVASMGSLAASGGYYVSAAADKIIANSTSITGSIGVITVVPNLEGLMDKLGVKAEVFTSGPHKDSTGFRPMSPEGREIIVGLVNDFYQRFVFVVAQGRGMDEAKVRVLADGRIYTAHQAKDAGLIDDFGDLEEAVKLAGEMGGIVGKPRVIEFREGGLFGGVSSSLLSGMRPPALETILRATSPFALQYLYLGP